MGSTCGGLVASIPRPKCLRRTGSRGRLGRASSVSVLEHGRAYESQRFTKEESRIVAAAIKRHGVGFGWQRCFSNSQALLECDDSGRIVYVEGFVYTRSLYPVLHGWAAINGKVVDVTLPPRNRREARLAEPLRVLGEFVERLYFGVPSAVLMSCVGVARLARLGICKTTRSTGTRC